MLFEKCKLIEKLLNKEIVNPSLYAPPTPPEPLSEKQQHQLQQHLQYSLSKARELFKKDSAQRKIEISDASDIEDTLSSTEKCVLFLEFNSQNFLPVLSVRFLIFAF